MKYFRLVFVGLFCLSCEKEPSTNSRGPQTSPTAIQKAQNDILTQLDPYKVKQGQRVHFVESQEVISSQGPQKFFSKEWITEVTALEDFKQERLITAYKTVTDKIWDENFIYTFKSVYSLPQIDELRLLDQLDQDRYTFDSTLKQLRDNGRVEASQITGVAFHNLKVAKVSVIPPPLISGTEGCKGIEDCRVGAYQMTYDVVFRLEDKSTQTHNVEWLISPEVPFFAALLKQCSTTILPIENLRVLVKQCSEVVDFDQ